MTPDVASAPDQETPEEELINDLTAVLWPRLDDGMSAEDALGYCRDVLDAWEPRLAE